MTRWFPVLGVAALVAVSALAASPVLAASGPLSPEANAAFLAANAHRAGVRTLPDGLQYRIIQNGFGKHPGPQDSVTVYYSLALIDGITIQGTEQDFPAKLQVNGVIAAWREALQLMREGDHWSLVVPPNLGYGPKGTDDGTVPPNQTLVFDLQLMKTEPPAPEPEDSNPSEVTPAAGAHQ